MRDVYFMGVDPAPSEGMNSDEGAVVVGRARLIREPEGPPGRRSPTGPSPPPSPAAPAPGWAGNSWGTEWSLGEAAGSQLWTDWWFDVVYARRLTFRERASARQYAGLIHWVDRRFNCERIVMDPNGGGTFVKRELIGETQLINGVETQVVPIGDRVDGPTKVVRGKFNLIMFKRGDPGLDELWPGLAGDEQLNDAVYCAVKEALELEKLRFPPPVAELRAREGPMAQPEGWWERLPEEAQWAYRNVEALQEQMLGLMAATKEDGTYQLTKRGAHVFTSVGKKDLVSGLLYAYAGFLVWLRAGEAGLPGGDAGDGGQGW